MADPPPMTPWADTQELRPSRRRPDMPALLRDAVYAVLVAITVMLGVGACFLIALGCVWLAKIVT